MATDENVIYQDRTSAAMGERVARVEAKIEGIEKSTDVIRLTMHDVAGDMQKFAIQEAECVATLRLIVEQTKHLPELVANVQSIEEMKPDLFNVIANDHRRKGGWKATIMLGTAAMGAVTMISAVGGGIIWFSGLVLKMGH